MATKAHCAFCFETLAASFEHRKPLELTQVEELWEQYHASQSGDSDPATGGASEDVGNDEQGEEAEMTNADAEEGLTVRPAAISRLLGDEGESSATSSSTSLRSTRSTISSSQSRKDGSGTATPASSKSSASSRSSVFSSLKKSPHVSAEFPLFVTWNTVSRSGHKSLRGCIGTFEAQELEYGLQSYALTSAFEDIRFNPIPASQLSSLSAHVTLLTNFSAPSKDPMNWTLGTHGLRIAFSYHGRRYGSTYLPDVAPEQGWSKEETLISLMKKAGWNGSSSSWQKAWKDGNGTLVTYEGKQVGLVYSEWREWRDWVDEQEGRSKLQN